MYFALSWCGLHGERAVFALSYIARGCPLLECGLDLSSPSAAHLEARAMIFIYALASRL